MRVSATCSRRTGPYSVSSPCRRSTCCSVPVPASNQPGRTIVYGSRLERSRRSPRLFQFSSSLEEPPVAVTPMELISATCTVDLPADHPDLVTQFDETRHYKAAYAAGSAQHENAAHRDTATVLVARWRRWPG